MAAQDTSFSVADSPSPSIRRTTTTSTNGSTVTVTRHITGDDHSHNGESNGNGLTVSQLTSAGLDQSTATLVEDNYFNPNSVGRRQKGLIGPLKSPSIKPVPQPQPVKPPSPIRYNPPSPVKPSAPAPPITTPLEVNSIVPPSIPLDRSCWPPITQGRPRTLVLCFDGTGDEFGDDNSNIVKFFRLLKKNDPTRQMCYYQAGIGTYSNPSIATPGAAFVANKLDEAVAWYLHAHVQEGYEFLMQNYIAGDRICIFGFSRGAYTARAVAGMVHSIGLIPPWNKQQVPFAWKIYRDGSPEGLIKASEFKATFSINVIIDYVGVFDTVASVGVLSSKELPFAASNRAIRVFRHALSLDERRVKFKTSHFHNPPKISDHTEDRIKAHQITGSLSQDDALRGKRVDPNATATRNKKRPETDALEVWFAGCHCDVGGGSVKSNVGINLAMIPLRWMIKETIATNTGILYDLAQLDLIGLTPHHLPLHPSVPYPQLVDIPGDHEGVGTRQSNPMPFEEQDDALSKKYDALQLAWPWWILEIIPFRTKQLNEAHEQVWGYPWPNLGRGRGIPDPWKRDLNIHRSVKYRINEQGYKPKAFWVDGHGHERYLDFKDPEGLPPINWID
ncbi:hypothetical protein SISNIDRAFT_429504 [Sistotremastrum niveocremeum HHB9708]|uniref:T6SS Phospholipase effector Tle1-like catalytic domain-containing protein n=2 Tax=Sistotremastraceae TaxID=3402574 RepID=A0A164TCS3_9AGAM|nr:hypothetical protein SISNIDRAFT_429504 [Sistotremastrum niveocremeum HHB9708]KZT39463.1 hypothetical protein SISSUDRAFT_1003346 [Sistotremastrum suecicum HHB10207 ss-3]